ncbi:exodeoxyribonuclease V subunit gamma [Candidatus Protochlamydia sp. W-9]|uniref:exodeoxyribonuclease V subunit gamma n=1 Tax=Candidatus Protochlamydia sp. W-9 TaxID=1785087 RepID=UPI00096AB840|nr:exodeoxyribonuclease V subunit gamma [Candidatus Protochlamydia sp. W-9]
MSDLEVFFSNQLSILYEQLKNNLFGFKQTPFKKRIVIVYGPAMQTWLTLKMAQDPDLGIAAGIEFLYLNQAFETLIHYFQLKNENIPSLLELSLAIEKELLTVLQVYHRLSVEEQQDWLTLIYYLKLNSKQVGENLKLTRKMEKRLTGLSYHLAKIFQDYGKYAYSLVSKWEKSEHRGWQSRLWKSLFGGNQGWTYWTKAFQKTLNFIPECEVHFFSISFISKAEFQFLSKLANVAPIYYYLLSPCAVFWSDIRSDNETRYLQTYWQQKLGSKASQVLQLEELLRDRNPLLANFGKLGREMAYQIEESQATTHAGYILPSHVSELNDEIFFQEDLFLKESTQPLTLLHAIQADILMMRNPEGKPPFNFERKDDSIQLHIAPSIRREIQILYHNLLKLFEKDSTLQPNDIIVMAPQISDYVPYIQSVFGLEKSQLDFQILDLGMQAQSEIVQGFFQLIRLSESRWEVSELLQLFGHRLFQRCHQLTQSDYYLIQEWIQQAGIRWGEDWLHRNELLQRHHCEKEMVDSSLVGTWNFGLTRLLLGLTTVVKSADSHSFDSIPCEGIDFSQAELMERWIRLLHSLRDDLSPLHDRSQMCMEEWSCYLSCLLDTYFKCEFEDSQSIADYEELKSQFKLLGDSAKTFKETKFSFQTIKFHLNNLLQQRGITYRENHLQTIRFCSMMPLRSIPAKVIAVLGMQEGAFPRAGYHTSLNLMVGQDNLDYNPNPTDYDRYLFLEALQSVTDVFIISYQGYTYQDSKVLQPSLIIEEFFTYLDKYYLIQNKKISEQCVSKHPFDAFDVSYFKPNSILNNYSQFDYRIAEQYYQTHKTPSHRLLKQFTLTNYSLEDILPSHTVIDLKTLNTLVRSPVKFYLNRGLDIYLEGYEDRIIKNQEELGLSALNKYQLKQFALKEPFEKVIQIADKEGKLPLGMFKTVATKRFKDEIDEVHQRLYKHGINPSELFQIEFCTSCSEPCQIQKDQWLLPALQLKYSDQYQISIIGKLPFVSKRGLVVLSQGSGFSDAWKAWPQFLLFNYATTFNIEPIERNLILSKSSEVKKAFFKDSIPYLKHLINYYALSMRNFSPLFPDWIPSLIEGNEQAIQNYMKQVFSNSFGAFLNQELRWVFNKDHLPCPKILIESWQEIGKQLAGDLIQLWYPPKKKKGEDA